MKTIIKSLLLSAVVSWHVTIDADVTSTIFLTQTSYSVDVTSDQGGYASLACVAHGLDDMSCTSDGPAVSSQGGFTLNSLSCTKKCCSATIATKDPSMDYNIDLCAHCLDSEVEKVGDAGGPSTRLTTRGCYGTKGYSFYEDGRIETIGGVGNPTLKYKAHGERGHSRNYKVHGGRSNNYKYNSYRESVHGDKYNSHEDRNHGHKYNAFGKLNRGYNYQ
ncbi:hypothetical protein CONCODRAFT_73214 [Conidiobolus coronatus NRRL 28638]|uniref:Cyanovirin-N domain-containing protein n=1 Tax=Conidiobolus coronatus (strain ATCC 28846 / CBS 209.66 / NRRL 28638) TaxID=796925 RepID=A0A137NWG8_CONC2|nr:hypothetical protein CONCODRAFT_73214 [Conidiobolus coronatus NRRL 28638]|eukprot:KXN67126.1 hypothetical protein CONCODRAFT_73214 [Conidiobolus coronatus NRRL 28638]